MTRAAWGMVLVIVCSIAAVGQTNEHEDDDGPLHFSHPIIVESPSPDTKIRFDYGYFRSRDAGERVTDHLLRVEAEYAFSHSFSIAVTTPVILHRPEFSPRETHTDEV